MWNILRSEWMKMRRCQILLVGVIALALCPVAQYGSQLMMAPELRDADFNFETLFANVVWGNSQVFLPISLVMIGGWMINREAVDDTLKNIVTIPIPMPGLLAAKLSVTAFLTLLFGIYSVCVTVITGLAVGLNGLTAALILKGGAQIVAASFTTYLVCTPIILICGRIRGAYLGGSVVAFFLGYSILFFKSEPLLSAYPFSAALISVGFDMTEYNGANTVPSRSMALASLGIVALVTFGLLAASGRRREERAPRGRRKRRR